MTVQWGLRSPFPKTALTALVFYMTDVCMTSTCQVVWHFHSRNDSALWELCSSFKLQQGRTPVISGCPPSSVSQPTLWSLYLPVVLAPRLSHVQFIFLHSLSSWLHCTLESFTLCSCEVSGTIHCTVQASLVPWFWRLRFCLRQDCGISFHLSTSSSNAY